MRIIERPPLWWRALCPKGLFRVSGCGRTVYLTFDDGPIPEVTPWVLDCLAERDIKATFFMVGDNARRYPYLVEAVCSAGHTLGNHAMHHLQGLHTSLMPYVADIEEARLYLDTSLFRPPHGFLRPSQAKALAGRYDIVMYDVVTRDYSNRLTAEEVLDNVRTLVRPGSIIVFHDSLKSWPRLREALPRSLDWLSQQNYAFATLKSTR
ncbi:MAG: polysaccharide deacetylase family protein [Muribaculaceae bacterium]|nr:polysaccharide deacetylase family protein [Muribaculaceae bacterium]